MYSTFYDSIRSWNFFLKKIVPIPILAALLFSQHVQADGPPTLETLLIVDKGDQLILNWNFHYNLLPPTFVLREKQGQTISLQDPLTLQQNLSDLISVAFDIRIDGRQVRPIQITKLTISPDKGCHTTLIYPGRPSGHLELRVPVLQYLPDAYVMSYQIFSLKNMGMGMSGDFLGLKGPFSSALHYVQMAGDGSSPPSSSPVESASATSFKAEIRTAWVNDNWLFICVVLLLMQMGKRVVILILSMMVCWILLCLLWAAANYKFPWQIPEIVLGLPTVLLCWITIKHPEKMVWLTLITLAAGILNACYDIQQIPLANGDKAVPALIGLCLGFVGGIALVLLVLVPLLWECKKYPEFQKGWAPRICWVIAGMAILLPLQKLFFG